MSAFGGIVGFNSEVEEDTAMLIQKNFFEVIVAPSYSKKSLKILKQKKKLRILRSIPNNEENLVFRSLSGDFLIQQQDSFQENWDDYNIVTEKKPSKANAKRRKSYCARSEGQMKKFPKAAKDPNSRLRQARKRWRCR